jgi:hypothetical protein
VVTSGTQSAVASPKTPSDAIYELLLQKFQTEPRHTFCTPLVRSLLISRSWPCWNLVWPHVQGEDHPVILHYQGYFAFYPFLVMSARSTSIPHRTSISSTTSSQPSHSISRTQQPQRLTAQQLAERVISPTSVLFPSGTAPPSRLQDRRSYTDMDRKLPSSFQQLEKVYNQ